MQQHSVTNVPVSAGVRMSPDALVMRDSWALVEPRADRVAEYFYARLFVENPELRDLFPVAMNAQRVRLLRALVRVMQDIDRPHELRPFLSQLGADHRKFGVRPEHYAAVGRALLAALRTYAGDGWTREAEAVWSTAYRRMSNLMLDAAEAVPASTPACWDADVIAVERRGEDIAVVTLHPREPFPYRAGQYVSVSTAHRERLWRPFSIANAPRPDGLVELHVRAVGAGWVSSALVWRLRVGDVVRLGAPMGTLALDPRSSRDLLCVAGGTGLAPLKAILEDAARSGFERRAHLFVGARDEHGLYDMKALWRMAARLPWLTVVPAVSDGPTWIGEHGLLPDVLERYGTWTGHDVLVSGSPSMIRATVARLEDLGVPGARIRYDPYDTT